MATESSRPSDRVFRFGPYELSERDGELRKNGIRIKFQEQPFRVLVPGELLFRPLILRISRPATILPCATWPFSLSS